MQVRYKALRIVGTFFKVIGGIAGIVAILFAIGICGVGLSGGALLSRLLREAGPIATMFTVYGGFFGFVLGIIVLVSGCSMALILFAVGEGIYVLLALEENTRLTSLLLQQQSAQPSRQVYQPVQQQPVPASS